MTWKLIREPIPQVQKICNECKKLIETLDQNHPTTKMLMEVENFDLDGSRMDFSALDFGMSPYHWCSVACVTGETKKDIVEKWAEKLSRPTTEDKPLAEPLFPTIQPVQDKPYTDQETLQKYGLAKRKRGGPRGRPPTTALKVIADLGLPEDAKHDKDV